ncbi:Serine/threonine-protein kinase pkn1 [compost metagenome]
MHEQTLIEDTMVWIPGGSFAMGSEGVYPEESPVRRVTVNGFWIEPHAVTNRQFKRFVAETGYVTVAERPLDPAMYPEADPALLQPGGLVFQKPPGRVDLRDVRNWWSYIPGANWRHPEGPESDLRGRSDHPVVQIAYEDAEAYACWAEKSLPTEAEWEYAARGGLDGMDYPWGDTFMPDGKPMANTWQGEFPWLSLSPGGHVGTVPVRSYPPNAYGLYEVVGNVWEWTQDWFAAARVLDSCCTEANPRGASEHASYDPSMPSTRIPRKVLKGGSFLCAFNYCRRYRPAARIPQMIDTATCHQGFRCIRRPEGRAR